MDRNAWSPPQIVIEVEKSKLLSKTSLSNIDTCIRFIFFFFKSWTVGLFVPNTEPLSSLYIWRKIKRLIKYPCILIIIEFFSRIFPDLFSQIIYILSLKLWRIFLTVLFCCNIHKHKIFLSWLSFDQRFVYLNPKCTKFQFGCLFS